MALCRTCSETPNAEAEAEVWSVKKDLSPSNFISLTVSRRYFCRGSLCCLCWCKSLYCFPLLCVEMRFSKVKVAEWPPFGKELLIHLTKCFFVLPVCLFVILVVFHFVFEGGL